MSSSSVRDGEDNGSDDDARAGIEKSLTAAFASRAVQLAQAVRNRRSLVSALKDHPELAAQKHGRGVEAVLSFWEGGNQAAERRRAVTKRVLAESRAKASAAALVAIFTDPAPQLSSLEDFVERRAGAPAQPEGLLGMLTPLLDSNRDGSVADDMLGMIGRYMRNR
jgi:hypothetical protein